MPRRRLGAERRAMAPARRRKGGRSSGPAAAQSSAEQQAAGAAAAEPDLAALVEALEALAESPASEPAEELRARQGPKDFKVSFDRKKKPWGGAFLPFARLCACIVLIEYLGAYLAVHCGHAEVTIFPITARKCVSTYCVAYGCYKQSKLERVGMLVARAVGWFFLAALLVPYCGPIFSRVFALFFFHYGISNRPRPFIRCIRAAGCILLCYLFIYKIYSATFHVVHGDGQQPVDASSHPSTDLPLTGTTHPASKVISREAIVAPPWVHDMIRLPPLTTSRSMDFEATLFPREVNCDWVVNEFDCKLPPLLAEDMLAAIRTVQPYISADLPRLQQLMDEGVVSTRWFQTSPTNLLIVFVHLASSGGWIVLSTGKWIATKSTGKLRFHFDKNWIPYEDEDYYSFDEYYEYYYEDEDHLPE